MYTLEEFNNYLSEQRGTGRTMRMIENVVNYVNEDKGNNIPEIVVMNDQEAVIIEEILREKGVEKAEIVTVDGERKYGRMTTNTFFHHTVAEYNMKNAFSIYERQIGDSK